MDFDNNIKCNDENLQKIKLLLAYDGSAFNGWQKQSRADVPTVQGTLEAVLSKIFDRPTQVVGSGRTDASVHAIGQVAHFWMPKDFKKSHLQHALQSLTPPEIVIRKMWLAPNDFHALSSSVGKTYRYFVLNRSLPNPFRLHYTTWIKKSLRLTFLNEASHLLIGTHDFASFQNSGTPVPSTVRTIFRANWLEHSNNILEFVISADGFLKQMVRNIVGTLVDLDLKKDKPSKISEILHAKDRQAAKKAAAPQGLYLSKVYYPKGLDKRCRQF